MRNKKIRTEDKKERKQNERPKNGIMWEENGYTMSCGSEIWLLKGVEKDSLVNGMKNGESS